MATLVVGDLHGRLEVANMALKYAKEKDYHVVFLGDYVDSFNRSIVDQFAVVEKVLEAIKEGRAEGLLGNHELSYMMPGMRCSGYKDIMEWRLKELDLTPLKPYTWAEGFLISHAGVSQRLLDSRNQTLQEYLDSGDYYQIGRARGGRDPVGGLFWCDWNDEFEPVPGVNQVVGHTWSRTGEFRTKEYSWCIDVLDTRNSFVLLDDEVLTIVDL